MKDSGASENHCVAFATAWNRGKDQVLKRIKKKSFGAPASLEAVDWKLHLQVKGSEPGVEEVCPKAVLHLELKNQSAGSGTDEAAKKSLNMEFDRRQLESLYNSFEDIQSQLDALT